MQPSAHLLCPRPQRCRQTDQAFLVPNNAAIQLPHDLAVAQQWLAVELDAWSVPPATEDPAFVIEAIETKELARQGTYQMEMDATGIRIKSSNSAGLFYGCMTALQWLRLTRFQSHARGAKRQWWGLVVQDYPDLAERGVMLDISRTKVPKLTTLKHLIDCLAEWKINQFQLYMEHTFAYRGHEVVWQDASPLTAEDVRELDAYCQQRFIRLVPNQNTFGHFHRWLKHDAYRDLAECPEGLEHPFSSQIEPFSLCATDERVDRLLDDLLSQLLPHFSAKELNVGLDETFDLGLGRSQQQCEARGKGRVYLDFLNRVHTLAAKHGCTIQFWGDIILDHPKLIPEIPADATAMAWGYEGDFDFDEKASAFAAAGRHFYTCPGTSSWFSIAGRWDNAVANLAQGALAAVKHGATGTLITDWGDQGHLQPLSVSWGPYMAGAAFAWQVDEARDPEALDLTTLLDVHVFNDRAQCLGSIWHQLGNVYRLGGFTPANGSALFFLIRYPHAPMTHERLVGLTRHRLDVAITEVDVALAHLRNTRLECSNGELAVAEARWSGKMLHWLCQYGLARLEPDKADRKALHGSLQTLISERERLWMQRNRPGGWSESRQNLDPTRLLAVLET